MIDCNIIFFWGMSCTQDLLYKFRELSSASFHTLNDKQVKALLVHFHSEVQSSCLKEVLAKPKKSKRIRKFNNKSAYKRYVRSCISTSINNIMLKICRDTDDKQQHTPEQQMTKTSGSLNLKLGSSSNYARKVKNFNKFMNTALITSNHQDLSCSICLQLLICPNLTICGHVFCSQCLDENLLFSNNCPNCRQNIKGSEPICCSLLDQFITKKAHLMQTQTDWKDHFFDRKNKFQNWKARRHIELNTLYVGQLVDVRDTESIWCQGAVQQIYQSFDNQLNQRVVSSVLIHYNRWHKLYNQIIELPTNRLAPLHFFSGRVDIPRYNLSQEQDNMRGSVVSGARIQNNQLDLVEREVEDELEQSGQEELQSTGSDDQEQEGANLPLNPNRSYFGIIGRRPYDRPINRRGGDYAEDQQMYNQQPPININQLVQAYMRRINENAFTYSLDQPQQNQYQSLNIPDQPRADYTDRELNGGCPRQHIFGKAQQKQSELYVFPYEYQSNQHKSNSAFELKQQEINEYPPPSDDQPEQLLQQQE